MRQHNSKSGGKCTKEGVGAKENLSDLKFYNRKVEPYRKWPFGVNNFEEWF